jgi:putative FmdB family regulatory protein
MPIFEYLCDDCGNKFEKLVRRSAEADGVECPSCGHDHVTTQVSSLARTAPAPRQHAILPVRVRHARAMRPELKKP